MKSLTDKSRFPIPRSLRNEECTNENAFNQIPCTLIGTLLGIAVAGVVAADWVDYEIREVSYMVDQKIDDVANAPARAASNTWEAIKQAASDAW